MDGIPHYRDIKQDDDPIILVVRGRRHFNPTRKRVSSAPVERIFIDSRNVERQRLFDIAEVNWEGVKTEDGDGEVAETGQQEWSDEETTNVSEKDDEWLGVQKTLRSYVQRERSSTSDSSNSDSDSTPELDQGCYEYMESMKYFWWILSVTGRMPFARIVEERTVKFILNTSSCQFYYFLLTSAFLVFCTITMGYSFTKILFEEPRTLTIYEQVERLDIDKYWIYALVTFAAVVLSSAWSLATIFDDGLALADYLTRWNLAISVLKYRPFENIRLFFLLHLIAFLVYSTLLIILYETDFVPAVKGTSGLIGLTLLLPFAEEIRFSPYFPAISRIGLFVHLYAFFSSRGILLMATLYCKLLVNMAKKCNLRLAYVLGMMGEVYPSYKPIVVIPEERLFSEHSIIIGFVRHTGTIFSVVFGIFYILKIPSLIILLHSLTSLLINPRPKLPETLVQGTPDYLPPVRHADPEGATLGTAIFFLVASIAEWMITNAQITTIGDTILHGYSYVRRYGLILCKTSEKRRFVQSILLAFSPRTDVYIRSFFPINREFTYLTFCILVTYITLLTAFHPFRLQNQVITMCNLDGDCVRISRSRISAAIAKAAEQNVPAIAPHIPPYTQLCQGSNQGKSLAVRLPQACNLDGTAYSPYPGEKHCLDSATDTDLPYADRLLPIFRISDCNRLGDPLDLRTEGRDSCRNLAVDNHQTRQPAILKAVKFLNPNNNVFYILCCYDYGFGNDQLNICNQQFPETIGSKCGIQENQRRVFPYRFDEVDPRYQKCFDNPAGPKEQDCVRIDDCYCLFRRRVYHPATIQFHRCVSNT